MLRFLIAGKYLRGVLIFAPLLLYPPFFFDQVVSPYLRVTYFLWLVIYLLLSNKFYSEKDGCVLLALTAYNLIMIGNHLNNLEEFYTVLNYDLTFIFAWGLFRYLRLDARRLESVLELYIAFFYLIVTCSVLSVVFFIALGEYDLFGIKSNEYTYYVTPFGVLFEKAFGPILVYRSCFYFSEPIYVGAFYAANIILIEPFVKNHAKFFVKANLVGGFFSMSMTFYFLLLLLYIATKLKSFKSKLGFVLISSFGIVIFSAIDILSYSSLSDRLYRYEIFVEIISNFDDVKLLFGQGLVKNLVLERGLSSGWMNSLVEVGIIGTILVMYLYMKLSPYFPTLILLIIFMAIEDPLRMPLFWMLAVMVSFAAKSYVPNKLST